MFLSKLDIDKKKFFILRITGHLDKMFIIPEDIEELVKKIKNPITIQSPNFGHSIPLEDPE